MYYGIVNVININISKALSSIDIERVGTRFIPLVRSIIPVKIVENTHQRKEF